MSYVPPHLRGGGGSAPAPDRTGSRDAPSSRTSSYQSAGRDSGRSSTYDRDRSSSAFDRQPSLRSQPSSEGRPSTKSTTSTSTGIEPIFTAWQPSERVAALSEEQVVDIRQRLNITVESPEGQPAAATPVESFAEMNLHAHIMADIQYHKYHTPTPIQAQGIPIGLSGRDILGCAETGSGKTASFAIPMIQHCLNQPSLRHGDGPMALVLAPTRELAQQIEREVKAFSRSCAVRAAIVVGGVTMSEQRSDLRSGVEVVVATPGRFIDHLQQGNTGLGRISFLVLDEADRMLDMGFEPQIREVMTRVPAKHQTLLFSATMPPEIEGLAQAYLTHPITVKVGAVSTPTANVSQSLESTANDASKLELLCALLAEEAASAERTSTTMCLTIVFVERKAKCDEVAQALREDGIAAVALHGGLGQNEREAALRDFSKGYVKVLVATDVASRGLDIKGIGHVINMDLPKAFEDYVHRIGRTGRAGARGRATSFYTDRDSFLVGQIKTAIMEVETGNAFAFATGKKARQEERQMALKFKENLKLGNQSLESSGSGAIKIDDRYAHMAAALAPAKAGTADAAWDD